MGDGGLCNFFIRRWRSRRKINLCLLKDLVEAYIGSNIDLDLVEAYIGSNIDL